MKILFKLLLAGTCFLVNTYWIAQSSLFFESPSPSFAKSTFLLAARAEGVLGGGSAFRAEDADIAERFSILTTDPERGRYAGGGRSLRITNESRGIRFYPENQSLYLADSFVTHLNNVLPQCIAEAARAGGQTGEVSAIGVEHMGGYVNRPMRNGTRLSMHATGRAIDFAAFTVTINGQEHRIPLTKATNDRSRQNGVDQPFAQSFYRAFVRCWSQRTAEVNENCSRTTHRPPSSPSARRRGYTTYGILDCNTNALHHDHLHAVLPFCPPRPGTATF